MIHCKSRKHAEATAWKWMSIYVRTKDADSNGYVRCFTCGSIHHWKDLDAGHFKKQGHYKRLKFNEKNVHPQCTRCNDYLGGNDGIYLAKLQEMYGPKIYDELMAAQAMHGRFSQYDFETLAAHYRALAKEQLRRLGEI